MSSFIRSKKVDGLFVTLFLLMIVAIIVTVVFFVLYLVSVFKKKPNRKKNGIVTLVGLVLSVILFFASTLYASTLPDADNETAEKPKTHKVEKKKKKPTVKKENKPKPKPKKTKKPVKKVEKKKPAKKVTKSKPTNKPKKVNKKPKVSKAEKNGKAYAKAINKLNMGTVEEARYDYKKNVLTYIGFDDMLTWKHSEFRKTLPILESWALKEAPKYDIYTGKLRIELLSENKTHNAHRTNTNDWQFER